MHHSVITSPTPVHHISGLGLRPERMVKLVLVSKSEEITLCVSTEEDRGVLLS